MTLSPLRISQPLSGVFRKHSDEKRGKLRTNRGILLETFGKATSNGGDT
jgi:hypothetical protein